MAQERDVRNRILYGDGDEASRLLVRRILETEGFLVTECAAGPEVLERARGNPPDLILLDLDLPGMDGFETLQGVRSLPGLADLPVIALTVRWGEEDRDRARKSGFQGYLAKPVQRLLLVEEIDRLLSSEAGRRSDLETAPGQWEDASLRGKRVLLVDDNPVHLQMGEKILRAAGMEVRKAVDGRDALRVLQEGERVDLILSDILMPGMDGYQFCRMVKTTGAYLDLPFVFFTSTYVDNRDVRFGLDLGADRYIVRPLPARRLLEILKEVLGDREAGRAVSAPVGQDALLADEVKYYREYNERLVGKLEQKLLEIDSAYHTLESRNRALEDLSKRLEQEVRERTGDLTQVREDLDALREQRAAWCRTLTQELRTPVTSIRSSAELLLQQGLGAGGEREELLRVILEESKRLESLIRERLDPGGPPEDPVSAGC